MIRRLRFTGVLVLLAPFTLSCSMGTSPPPPSPGPDLPPAVIPAPDPLPYLNPDLPLEVRVGDLLGRMTLEEKVSQTLYNAVAVAADPEARGKGVMVVANDEIHGARAIIKSNTTEISTFDN